MLQSDSLGFVFGDNVGVNVLLQPLKIENCLLFVSSLLCYCCPKLWFSVSYWLSVGSGELSKSFLNMERKTIDLEQGWDYMQTGITKLKRILEGLPEPAFDSEQYMMLYTYVF